jgi:hypothetical protein
VILHVFVVVEHRSHRMIYYNIIGEGLVLNAQVDGSVDPERVCGYLETVLEELTWNQTEREYPQDRCVHELFEE